jgi:uncharacterized protein (UPF0276 family)
MEPMIGMGLRPSHYGIYLQSGSPVPWVEAITENFLGRGGRPRAVLERVRQDSELILHGVSLSIGGLDPLDTEYLRELKALRRDLAAAFVSDHLCFGTVGGFHGHDLWPLPLNEESLAHVTERVQRAQDAIGAPLVLENASTYAQWRDSTMSEPEFFAHLNARTGCQMLLDINNIVVCAHNHGWQSETYLAEVPANAVAYYHLAGHGLGGPLLLDTHQGPMQSEVLALYERALAVVGPRPTIVEWDGDVPPIDEVLSEVDRARAAAARALESQEAA